MSASRKPTEVEIETYMRGECHVHAIAAVLTHGGAYAVAYDEGEPYHVDEEGESVTSVIHVWSLHETDGGLVARDVLGDIPAVPEAMQDHLEESFPSLIGRFQAGDVWIDMLATVEEIEDLSGDEDHHPLFGISEADIEQARALPSVSAAPGTRRIMPGEELSGENVPGFCRL